MALLLRDVNTVLPAELAYSYQRTGSGLTPIGGGTANLLLSYYDLAVSRQLNNMEPAEGPIEQFRVDVTRAWQADGQRDTLTSTWWQPLVYGATGQYRFLCSPVLSRPIGPQQVAQASPNFIENVSQCIIDFAGDFVTQEIDQDLDGDGRVDLGKPVSKVGDGVIDFVPVDATGNRAIRWYGRTDASRGIWQVGDFRALTPASQTTVWPFVERRIDANTYVCVWYNSSPAFVRINLKIEDPTGRLVNGPWHQFVIGPN